MIFYDYDGVIVDSLDLCINSCRFAANKLGFKERLENPYENLNPVTYRAVARNLGLDESEFERLASDFVRENLGELRLFGGTKKSLETLSKSYELSILSSTNPLIIDKALRNLGIRECFKNIYGGTAISKYVKLKTYATKGSIMIGDTISDIEQSKEAGVYAIAVLWGWHDKERLKDANAFAKDQDELLQVIDDFYRKF